MSKQKEEQQMELMNEILSDENLIKLGMEPWKAYRNGNTRKGYWAIAGSGILKTTITNERLARAGLLITMETRRLRGTVFSKAR